jgi:hypothetical protein
MTKDLKNYSMLYFIANAIYLTNGGKKNYLNNILDKNIDAIFKLGLGLKEGVKACSHLTILTNK